MGDAVTLIVLVATGAARDPTTVAMTGATRDALGGAVVEVRETRSPLDDEAALAVETSAHADAVVELGWADPRHRQATLRLHIAAGRRWIERVIRFTPSDAFAERGRTLGFAVASMLPEAAADRTAPPATPSPGSPANPTPATTPTPTPSPTGATPATPPESPPATPAAASPPPATAPPPAPQSPAPAATPPVAPSARNSDRARVASTAERPGAGPELALDVLALGDISDSADGVGGSAAGHWFVLRNVSLRLAAAVRAGSITSTSQTSTLTLLGAAGIAWHPLRSTSSQPLGVSLRVDYLLERPSVTHISETQFDSPAWISGADAVAEAGWQISPDADLVLGLGLEDVFAHTYIHLRDTLVATLPPLSAVGEAGVRLRF